MKIVSRIKTKVRRGEETADILLHNETLVDILSYSTPTVFKEKIIFESEFRPDEAWFTDGSEEICQMPLASIEVDLNEVLDKLIKKQQEISPDKDVFIYEVTDGVVWGCISSEKPLQFMNFHFN